MVYCNLNYTLLGEIVKRVSGQPLEVFARERLFAPLGMKDTDYVLRDDQREKLIGRPLDAPLSQEILENVIRLAVQPNQQKVGTGPVIMNVKLIQGLVNKIHFIVDQPDGFCQEILIFKSRYGRYLSQRVHIKRLPDPVDKFGKISRHQPVPDAQSG